MSPVTTPHHAVERFYCAQLFLAVLLGMSLYCLYCLFSMPSAMNYVAPRGVSVPPFRDARHRMLGALLMVTGGMLKMF